MANNGWKKNFFETFCNHTGIHGFQYVTSAWSGLERIIWSTSMVISFVVSTIILQKMVLGWSESPVQITIKTTAYPVYELPFPTVTVCSQMFNKMGFPQKILNMLNPKDPTTRAFFQDEILFGWKVFENGIHNYVSSMTYSDAKEKLDVICKNYKNNQGCYAMYLLFKLCDLDGKVAKTLRDSLLANLSYDAFSQRGMDSAFSKIVVPAVRKAMIENNFTCDNCFTSDLNWWSFVNKFSSTTFCLEPAGYACKSCFTAAFLMRLQIEVMFSLPLTHLGTAFASGLFRGNNTLVEKFYRKLSGTNSTSFPPELVEILSTNTENNDLLVHDARSNFCWGSEFINTINFSYESVPKCCSDQTACDLGTFQSIFYIMKESMGQPHPTYFDWNYKEFTGLLDSSTLSPPPLLEDVGISFPAQINPNTYLNLEPFIPFCKLFNLWRNKFPQWGTYISDPPSVIMSNTSFCTLFRPVFTDKGICYAFNAKNPNDQFKSSNYMRAFTNVFGDDEDNTREFNISGTGVQNGFRFILDAHSLTGTYIEGKDQNITFKLALGQVGNLPLLFSGGLEVQPGERTSIVVTPSVFTSTSAVGSLGVQDRNCKFRHEVDPKSILNTYTHSGCLYECLLNQARDVCGCTPWDQPSMGTEHELCDLVGNICFKGVFENVKNLRNCSCVADCDKILYPYYVIKKPIDPMEVCMKKNEFPYIEYYLKSYLTPVHMGNFWLKMSEYSKRFNVTYVSGDSENFCTLRMAQDISIVEVLFSNQFVTMFEQDVRTSFSDKISNIGGTLGVFCGASILSFLELIIWIVKFLNSLIKTRNPRQ